MSEHFVRERPNRDSQIQSQREELYKRLANVRHDRDEKRTAAYKPVNRIKDFFGRSDGSATLHAEADAKQAESQLILKEGKEELLNQEQEILFQQQFRQVQQSIKELQDFSIETSQFNSNIDLLSTMKETIFIAIERHLIQEELLAALMIMRQLSNRFSHIDDFRIGLEKICSLLAEKIPILEKQMQTGSKENLIFFHTLEWIADNGTPVQRAEAMAVFSRHIETIDNDPYEYSHALETICAFGTDIQREHICTMMNRKLQAVWNGDGSDLWRLLPIVSRLHAHPDARLQVVSTQLVENIFRLSNLNYKDFNQVVNLWFQKNVFIEAIQKMRILENAQPGITKFLIEERGIQHIYRYSDKILLQQYVENEDTTLPYGVVVFPETDWNGAFRGATSNLGDFYDKTNGQYHLRLFECRSTYGLLKILITADKHYGAHHKISFAIIGGHGAEDAIQFGDYEVANSSVLYKENIAATKSIPKIKDFFVPNPTIILQSCSTGKDDGIAQLLSQQLGAHLFAPDQSTSVKSIQVTMQDGQPMFTVKYIAGKTKEYLSGKLLADSASNPSV